MGQKIQEFVDLDKKKEKEFVELQKKNGRIYIKIDQGISPI